MQAVRQLSAPVGITLSRFIAQEQKNIPDAKEKLSQVLSDISLGGKIMNRDFNRAGLIQTEGSTEASNL